MRKVCCSSFSVVEAAAFEIAAEFKKKRVGNAVLRVCLKGQDTFSDTGVLAQDTSASTLCFYCTSLLTWFPHTHFRQFKGSEWLLASAARDNANSDLSPPWWRSLQRLFPLYVSANYRPAAPASPVPLWLSAAELQHCCLQWNALPLVISALWRVNAGRVALPLWCGMRTGLWRRVCLL